MLSSFPEQDLWSSIDLILPAVGASGAIYGILVAFGITYPNAKLALIFFPVPIAAKYFIPLLIGLDLFSGMTGFSIFGGGIAHFAHIGGAIIGFFLMWYWRGSRVIRNNQGRLIILTASTSVDLLFLPLENLVELLIDLHLLLLPTRLHAARAR